MENTQHDIDDLIGKYLSGESSSEENKLVEKWIAADEANRNYFNHVKLIFDKAATVREIQQFDTDQAWKKLKSKMRGKPEGRVVPMAAPSSTNWMVRIAASIVIIIGVGFFTYRYFTDKTTAPVEFAADQSIKSDTLPDGTSVVLNKKTELAYSLDRRAKKRIVKLKGEAFFEIHPDAEQSFEVDAEDVLIRDIGTSFNVKAYAEGGTVEVFVEEGEVELYTATNEGIHVHAGETGVYHRDTKTFTLEKPEPNVTSYKSKEFTFSDSNLQSIVDRVNEVYDRKIKIQPHLASCRLTVSFSNESIEEIAGVIAETLGLAVTAEGNDLLLEGKACEN